MAKQNGPQLADPGKFPYKGTQEDQKAFWEADSNYHNSYEYEETCECGTKHIVWTQQDSCPEYYTTIKIKCNCGKMVPFSLPVN